MEREGEGQREWQRQRERVRMRSLLQNQRRTAGAGRHVGHAPELRWEQRAGGLLEASHTFLTTASAADFSFRRHRRLGPADRGSVRRVNSVVAAGKFRKSSGAGEGREGAGNSVREKRETTRRARVWRSGGVLGAQVARPACGDGLSGEAGARSARRARGRAHLAHLGACAALAQPPRPAVLTHHI